MTEAEAMFKYSVLTKSRNFRDVMLTMSTMLWSSDSCTGDCKGRILINNQLIAWNGLANSPRKTESLSEVHRDAKFFHQKRVRLIFSLKLSSNSEV